MNLISIRMADFLAFLCCVALLLLGFYIEIAYKVMPCPLCILQRIVFVFLGILFLIGSLLPLKPLAQRYYHIFIALIALGGAALAGRQIWLEHLPPEQLPSCVGNFKLLFQVLPFTEALQTVFQGTSNCAKVTWRLWGFSIPSWSFLTFGAFASLAMWQAFRKQINKKERV